MVAKASILPLIISIVIITYGGLYYPNIWYFVCGALVSWWLSDVIFRIFHFSKDDPDWYFVFIVLVVFLSAFGAFVFSSFSNTVYVQTVTRSTAMCPTPLSAAVSSKFSLGLVAYQSVVTVVACSLAWWDAQFNNQKWEWTWKRILLITWALVVVVIFLLGVHFYCHSLNPSLPDAIKSEYSSIILTV
ncbi:MAG: hypothetical protein ABSF63_13355 [Candidatus Bathyarchaeia archaeon]